jgi:hypothetical protein
MTTGGIDVKVFVVHDFTRTHLGGNLNMRQLLNPLFFERACRHVDMKRQRSRRVRSRAVAQARRLKYMSSTWVPDLSQTHARKLADAPYKGDYVSLMETLRVNSSTTWWEL